MNDGCTCPQGIWYTELCDYCIHEAVQEAAETHTKLQEVVKVLNQITEILSDDTWGPDTLEAIATTIRISGLNTNTEEGLA